MVDHNGACSWPNGFDIAPEYPAQAGFLINEKASLGELLMFDAVEASDKIFGPVLPEDLEQLETQLKAETHEDE